MRRPIISLFLLSLLLSVMVGCYELKPGLFGHTITFHNGEVDFQEVDISIRCRDGSISTVELDNATVETAYGYMPNAEECGFAAMIRVDYTYYTYFWLCGEIDSGEGDEGVAFTWVVEDESVGIDWSLNTNPSASCAANGYESDSEQWYNYWPEDTGA